MAAAAHLRSGALLLLSSAALLLLSSAALLVFPSLSLSPPPPPPPPPRSTGSSQPSPRQPETTGPAVVLVEQRIRGDSPSVGAQGCGAVLSVLDDDKNLYAGRSGKALDKIRFESLTVKSKLEAQPELFIHIVPDKASNTLSIIDSGIGMTKLDA